MDGREDTCLSLGGYCSVESLEGSHFRQVGWQPHSSQTPCAPRCIKGQQQQEAAPGLQVAAHLDGLTGFLVEQDRPSRRRCPLPQLIWRPTAGAGLDVVVIRALA